jgi:hypothetical protein
VSEVAFLGGFRRAHSSRITRWPASLLVESDFTSSAVDEQASEPALGVLAAGRFRRNTKNLAVKATLCD